MTSVAELLSWRPAEVRGAAADVAGAAASLDARVRDLDSAFDAVQSHWSGVAADAARSRAAAQSVTGTRLAAALESARTALDTGATAIDGARTELVSIRSDAGARGYRVLDDGGVLAPPVTPIMHAPEAAAEAAAEIARQEADLLAEAERIAAAVGRTLDDAASADTTLAAALTGLEVPDGLRASVSEALARREDGQDFWSAITGASWLGGAAVTAKALLGGFKVFGKTSAYASFFTNALKGAWHAGPALRWLTTGAGDASSWLSATRAIDAMSDAQRVFQVGKTPTWLAGARTVAGKAFLPLTMVTGGLDAITGGGYDGARGVTTRVLGGAGALGAGAIAFGLASNPVGWAIAGGAVALYTAWSVGNFVYDHWDDITDFGGKALDWGKDRLSDAGDALSSAADYGRDRLADAGDAVGDAANWVGGTVSGGLDALGKISIF